MSNETQNRQSEIAHTILRQLGGTHRLAAMTGARHFVALENGVTFRIRGSRQANYVQVKLNGLDLYDIQTGIVGRKHRNIKKFEGVYADQMKGLIEQMTGLYLSF